MDLHPLAMEGVLHVDSENANVRTHRRKVHNVRVMCAGGLGVGLRYRKSAYDFQYQIRRLVFLNSGVQQILELRIHFQATVSISVCLMADAIRLSASGGIHNRSRQSDTLLMHDQPVGMVDVGPQVGITTGVWRWSRNRSRSGSWWRRSRRNVHIDLQDPANLLLLPLNILDTAIRDYP